jgi:hypothetical protein
LTHPIDVVSASTALTRVESGSIWRTSVNVSPAAAASERGRYAAEVRCNLSIKTRIEDAEHLWAEGRKEGAWVQALIAAAATARRRYPRPIPDNQSFKSFICDIAGVIMTGRPDAPGPQYIRFYSDNRADHRKLEDIFYSDSTQNCVAI